MGAGEESSRTYIDSLREHREHREHLQEASGIVGEKTFPVDSDAAGTVGTAIREVLSLPVRYLAELPAPSALTLRLPALDAAVGLPVALVLTTSRQRAQEAAQAARRGRGAGKGSALPLALTPLEYEALAVALADGRVTPSMTIGELAGKLMATSEGRELRLTRERLLGPVRHAGGDGEAWTFGELFEVLGAELVSVEVVG